MTARILVIAIMAVLSCQAATAPNVTYAAFGTFATLQISGADTFCLRGQPFSITIVANEGLKPTRHSKTSAQYTNLSIQGAVQSCLDSQVVPISSGAASIALKAGGAGDPDEFKISFPLFMLGAQLTISAQATMPAGTLATTAFRPFTGPVALTISDASVTYAEMTYSTTLGVANGNLNAAVATPPPPGLAVLYTFTGRKGDGANPYAGLVIGSGGVVYGTTYSAGTVFSVTPPATPGNPWTEAALLRFTGYNGQLPRGSLVLSQNGSLFGTTTTGGAQFLGAVFEVTPPASPGGAWTEAVVYSFTCCNNGDGQSPLAGVVIGPGGTLYGTTGYGGTGFGTVFELTPPAAAGGAWTETVLYSFTGQNGDGANPYAGLVIGSGGVLYGTTYNGGANNSGAAFALTPPVTPGSPWSESVLYTFTGQNGDGASPYASLAVGPTGALYGTTQYGGAAGGGTVFQLTPPVAPGNPWTESVLYSFQGPAGGEGAYPTAGVLISKSGTLYGTTYAGGTSGWGTAFKLTPPTQPVASWSEAVLTNFNFF